jgi:hypothetical protein
MMKALLGHAFLPDPEQAWSQLGVRMGLQESVQSDGLEEHILARFDRIDAPVEIGDNELTERRCDGQISVAGTLNECIADLVGDIAGKLETAGHDTHLSSGAWWARRKATRTKTERGRDVKPRGATNREEPR